MTPHLGQVEWGSIPTDVKCPTQSPGHPQSVRPLHPKQEQKHHGFEAVSQDSHGCS